MKRFIKILLFALLIFSFSSCGAAPVRFFDGEFEAKVSYSLCGKDFDAVYTREAGGETLEILAPKTLAGLVAKRSGGSLTLEYADLAFLSSAESIFEPFALLSECEAVSVGDGIYKNEEKNLTISVTDGVPVRVYGTVCDKAYEITITEFSERNDAK